MRKAIITASVVATTSFSALADEQPKLYGRLDLSVTQSKLSATVNSKSDGVNSGHSGTYLEDNSSRLGVKGKNKISNDLDIFYKVEFGIRNISNYGDDSSKVIKARSTYLGVKSSWGTLLVGRNNSVFKTAEGKVDLFSSSNADIKMLIEGQERVADGLWYYSPKLMDLIDFNVTYLMKDNYDSDSSQYALSSTMGDKKLKKKKYYVSVAMNKGIAGVDAYRLTGQVKLGDVKLGGLVQKTESLKYSNMEGNSYFITASYDLDFLLLKAKLGYDESGLGKYFSKLVDEDYGNISDVEISSFTLGAEKAFSKKAKVYGHIAMYKGEYQLAGVKKDVGDDTVLTMGVRYNF